MTEKNLNETIVSQALEITKLRKRLDVSEWFRKFNLESYEGAKEELADLKAEIYQLKDRLDNADAYIDTVQKTDDDISIGLTD